MMTDKELVKRLLDFDKVTVGDARDAALRIEALTAKNEMLGREVNIARYGQPNFAWSVHVQVMDDLNAKLAKAVEALRVLIQHAHNCEKELTEELHHQDFCGESLPLTNARATLAEIEGEKE
jgi:hypothetical protein